VVSLAAEIKTYYGRMAEFDSQDWLVYVSWVGLMLGLLAAVSIFLSLGAFVADVTFPAYVWNIPLGIAIFAFAIATDTIGHRTVYKAELQKAEALVHHITIFCGVTSCVLLTAAYDYRDFLAVPALVLVALSIFYSIVDEAMHWQRYMAQKSDRVEMWSHFGIFCGHMIMLGGWVYWFYQGYPGVAETLAAFRT
jgi:uncharacterized integral membrane protein